MTSNCAPFTLTVLVILGGKREKIKLEGRFFGN
jgi:hypothetical protein